MNVFLEGHGLLDHTRVSARHLLLADDGHGHRLSGLSLRHILILLQHREDDVRRGLPEDALRAGGR